MNDTVADPSAVKHSAPAKLILMGEHFVVHGCPAVAIPVRGLDLEATLWWRGRRDEHLPGCEKSPEVAGRRKRQAESGDGIRPTSHLKACVELAARHFGLDPDRIDVDICSSIPVGSGLGSSAAVSVAVAGAVAKLAGRWDPPRSVDELRTISLAAETLAHGKPSGIDTEVCLTQRAVLFTKGSEPTPMTWERAPCMGLVVMNTGVASSTAKMVSLASDFADTHPREFERLCDETREAVERTKDALQRGDLEQLASLIDHQHGRLRELGVSCQELERDIATARRLGALGAKLSGSGGGGVAFAVCPLGHEGVLGGRLEAEGVDVVKATTL